MDITTSTSQRLPRGRRARRSGRPPTTEPEREATANARRAQATKSRARRADSSLKPVPAVIDLSKVSLDELDIASLSVGPGDHLTLDGGHALSARDTDPLALGLFALLRGDCHADRLLVWHELANTLDGEVDEDGQLALAAARLCCDDLAAADAERDFRVEPLSEREYKSWWLDDEDRKRSWPSVSSVRRWVGRGSWSRVVEHLGQTPTPGALGQRLAAQLGAFSPDELKACLALCRVELAGDARSALDYVTYRVYRDWAMSRLHDPGLPLPRLCLQPHPFRDTFGSWGAAVAASGGCRTDTGRQAATRATRRHGLYTAEACVEAVHYVGERAGGGRMRMPDYDEAAQALRTQADPPDDLPAVLPSANTIVLKLGSWPQALHIASLIDEAERDRRLARVTVTLSDKKLLAVLADALRAIGADAPKQRYRRYREAMRAECGPHVGLPSLATVYQRLGYWHDAKAVVIAAHPDVANCTPTWTDEEDH